MSVRDRLIQLTLRARNFLSGDVAPATESMRELTEEGRRLKASMEDVGRARGLARTLRDNQQATEGLARAQDDARATLDDLTRELGDNAEATAGQRIAMREARRTLDEAERAYKKNQSAIKNLTTELKQMGVDTDNVTAEEKRLAGELEDGKKALADNRDAIKQKRVEEKKAADVAKEHADRVDATSTAMNDAGRKVLGFVAAYVSLNAVMGLVQSGLRLVAQGIRAVALDGSDKQQALGQLEAALASTGRQAEFTSQQLLDMADAFEASSMLTAEQVQAGQARLLSYTDVAAKEFPRAMQIIIDQQQRLGISVEQSAEIVGRALQSPSEAITALGRQGFKLEDGQKRLLKQLEATGKTAEAQAIIMDMLSEAYGGSAAAARMNTAAGLWKGLTDRVGDFTDRVGKAGAFDFIQRKLLELSSYLDEMANDGRLDALAEALSTAFIDAAERAEVFAKKLLEVDFKTLADDASRWLDGFGEKLDTAGRWITLIGAPIRALTNVVTGGISLVGVAFTGLVTASLSGMALVAKAIPDAFGGKTVVAGLERARDTASGMMKMLAGQVAQDGRDIAATWESVAVAAESSAERQSAAARRAADETRQTMQQNGESIASFFRQNIATLEQGLAAVAFSETTQELAEIEAALLSSALAGDELALVMTALAQKRGFVDVGQAIASTAETAQIALTDMASALQLIDTASSVQQLEGLRGALLKAFQDGRITQEQYAQATGLLNGKLGELGGAADDTGDALSGLSDEFGDIASIMRAVGSAMNEVDFNRLRSGIRKAYADGKISAEEFAKAQAELNKRIADLKPAADKGTKALGDQRKAIDENMQAARRGVADVGDAAEGASGGIDFFGAVLTAARTPLANMSKAALAAFDALRGIKNTDIELDVSSAEKTAAALGKVREEALGLTAELGLIGSRDYGFGTWMRQTALASREVQAQYLEQKLRLQELMAGYEAGSIGLADFTRRAGAARQGLGLLDESDLSSLESALDAAKQKMEALGDSTRSTLEGLQMELLQLQGTQDEIERAKFASRRNDLLAQQADAQKAGDSAAVANLARALRTLNEIEDVSASKRQQAEQQKRAEETAKATPPATAPAKIIRLETARGKAVEVAVNSATDETNLLSILEDAGLRSL